MNRINGCLLAMLLLQGCAQTNASSDTTLPVERLYSNSQCGALAQSTAVWISDAAEWQQFYAQANNLRMTPPLPPAVDFSRESVLLVAMGQQTSGGYGLTLATREATVSNDVLTVQVDWIEPSPDYMQTQVMTNPCLFVRVPTATFTQIEVRDKEGQLRLKGRR